jgi:hypothetical protein
LGNAFDEGFVFVVVLLKVRKVGALVLGMVALALMARVVALLVVRSRSG